ncbi:MAG: hypothetical protein ACYCYK_12490 [Candidatus Dormibacteria bacterium]
MEEKMTEMVNKSLADLLDYDNNPTDLKNFLQFIDKESELLFIGSILLYLA